MKTAGRRLVQPGDKVWVCLDGMMGLDGNIAIPARVSRVPVIVAELMSDGRPTYQRWLDDTNTIWYTQPINSFITRAPT